MEEATKDFSEGLSEEEFDEALEEAENQETYDQETGLDLEIVLTAARDQDIDLFALEEGESVEFYVEAPSLIVTYAASTTKKVTITRGSWYYYADYGLGSYQTAPYKVKYGNVSATAYCVQPSKRGPDDGTYKITKLSDGKSLAKVCYYGTKASGDDGFFAEKASGFFEQENALLSPIWQLHMQMEAAMRSVAPTAPESHLQWSFIITVCHSRRFRK